jgi:hypothetical protein
MMESRDRQHMIRNDAVWKGFLHDLQETKRQLAIREDDLPVLMVWLEEYKKQDTWLRQMMARGWLKATDDPDKKIRMYKREWMSPKDVADVRGFVHTKQLAIANLRAKIEDHEKIIHMFTTSLSKPTKPPMMKSPSKKSVKKLQ